MSMDVEIVIATGQQIGSGTGNNPEMVEAALADAMEYVKNNGVKTTGVTHLGGLRFEVLGEEVEIEQIYYSDHLGVVYYKDWGPCWLSMEKMKDGIEKAARLKKTVSDLIVEITPGTAPAPHTDIFTCIPW